MDFIEDNLSRMTDFPEAGHKGQNGKDSQHYLVAPRESCGADVGGHYILRSGSFQQVVLRPRAEAGISTGRLSSGATLTDAGRHLNHAGGYGEENKGSFEKCRYNG